MVTCTPCRERETGLHHIQGFTYPIMQVEELKDVARRRAPRDPPVVLAGFSAGHGLRTSGMQQTYVGLHRTEAHTAQIHGTSERLERRKDKKGRKQWKRKCPRPKVLIW